MMRKKGKIRRKSNRMFCSWCPSNDFLIHSEGIVSGSRRRKERSGAGKTWMDSMQIDEWRFDV